jgi:D-alanyl-D-alanine carboxypeptidase
MTDNQAPMTASRPRPTIRKITLLVAALWFASGLAPSTLVLAQNTDELDLSSKRFIVIDANTGEIIAEQNADERVAIASLTKVFTAIEALERGELDQLITTKSTDLYDTSSSLMGFGPDETFTLEDLLYGMMLPSGNDAAHAIARALGETPDSTDDEAYENFVQMMNERVDNMGLADTHFMNPHGWGVEGHYSTARDVATFMMYALQYPTFQEIIGTSAYTTSNGQYTLFNNNRLLNIGYSGLIGGKTGFDNDSGWCLIEVASRGDTTLISVTLDGEAPDTWYQDNVELLDTGFSVTQEQATGELPAQGALLSYRDPDAALILGSTASGSSIGDPSSGIPQSQSPSFSGQAIVPASQGDASATTMTDANESSTTKSDDRSTTLAVIAVACLIGAVAALKAFGTRLLASRRQPG